VGLLISGHDYAATTSNVSLSLYSAMPGSDSEEEIDDGEFDNEGEEDIEQELFDAIEAGAEEATDGDAVCYSNRSYIVYGTADWACNRNPTKRTPKKMKKTKTRRMMLY